MNLNEGGKKGYRPELRILCYNISYKRKEMGKMKFELTEELKTKLKACKTPEEVLALAKENNMEISLEEIKAAFYANKKELSDDDLDNVAGGCCDKTCECYYPYNPYSPNEHPTIT